MSGLGGFWWRGWWCVVGWRGVGGEGGEVCGCHFGGGCEGCMGRGGGWLD